MIILQAIGVWMLIGICVWFFKVFIYFRGPRNTVEWILRINGKYSKNDPTIKAIKENPSAFVLAGLVIYSVIGPISILDFINVIVGVNQDINKK